MIRAPSPGPSTGFCGPVLQAMTAFAADRMFCVRRGLLEQDGARAREVALKLFDVADRGPAEGVDRLVSRRLTNRSAGVTPDPSPTGSSHEDVLGVVRVLVLVDQDGGIAGDGARRSVGCRAAV